MESLKLEKNQFVLVSAHRQENIDFEDRFKNLLETIEKISTSLKLKVLVSTHPRTRKLLTENIVNQNTNIIFHDPFNFSDYNHLQKNALIVISDSGTISEESSILNFRALNIREAHERPEAMEEASVMMVGLEPESIIRGLVQLEQQKIGNVRNYHLVSDYSMPNVSEKVIRIILSYTDYINRVVWKKV